MRLNTESPKFSPDDGQYLPRLRDVRLLDHRISWVNSIFLTITHLLAVLVFLPLYFSPTGLWKFMLAYFVVHVWLGLVSTTAYAHRMVSHRATQKISPLVHLFFGYIGQTLAVQGSIAEWAGRHRAHHAVDGHRKHAQDPYSAVWFKSKWQNFVWSHFLCYFFHHPSTDTEYEERINRVLHQYKLLGLQHRWYLFFLIAVNYALPFMIGMWVGGTLWTGICFVWTAVTATVLIQQITWTVNSFTHLFGIRAARSSARNNYFWLLPLGEGNHHADHHDAPTDYRNGFGWSGWVSDPTRYVLIVLRWLRLIGPLQRTSRALELRALAERKIKTLKAKFQNRQSHERWLECEARLEEFKVQLVNKAKACDRLLRERVRLFEQKAKLSRTQWKKQWLVLKSEIEKARLDVDYAQSIFKLEVEAVQHALQSTTESNV